MLVPSIFKNNKNEVAPFGFDFFEPDFFGANPLSLFDDFADIDKKLYGNKASRVMATDVKETDDGYEVDINIPGFKKEEIALELNDGYLSVSTHKEVSNNEEKKGKLIRQERYMGSMARSFYVGDNITEEDIKAKFEHGVLKLTIPKKEEKKEEPQHRIAIEG